MNNAYTTEVAVFDTLLGREIDYIDSMEEGSHEVRIRLKQEYGSNYDNEFVRLFHEQECCESVYLEDVNGDPDDLLRGRIVMFEAVTQRSDDPYEHGEDSLTWTFFKIATTNGTVVLRWYGGSNGWYSEDVTVMLERVEELRLY